MSNKIFKKLMSIVLAMALVLGMVPGMDFTPKVYALTTGTADGIYDFGGLTTTDVGGGYVGLGDKFKVEGSKQYVQSEGLESNTNTAIYPYDVTARGSSTVDYQVIFKAEGGSTCKTFTFKDLGMSAAFDIYFTELSISFKNAFGDTISEDVLGESVENISQTSVSQLSQLFGLAQWNVSDVASIQLVFSLNQSGAANLQFENITIADVSNNEAPTKIDPTITNWPTVSNITYGQTFADAISGGSAIESGTFSIADATTQPSVAGSPYNKIITFTPNETATYNSVTTTASVAVNKADAVISDITCPDKTYDVNPLNPSSTVTTGTGSIAYTYSGTGISGSTTTAPSETGTYTVTATLPASSDYNMTSKSKAVTISKANQTGITITNQPASPVYGDTFNLGTTGGSGTGSSVTWSAIGCANVTSTGAVTVSGVGNVTITAIKAGDTNYNDVTGTYTFTTGKSNQAPVAYNDITKTYGDTTFTHAATGGSGTGAVSFTSSDTSVATIDAASGSVSILKAGTTTLTATKAGDDSYNAASDTCILTVSPKTITASAIAIDKTYNGNTSATGTISFIGLKAGDEGQVTGSGIFAFTDPNAGDGKTVNVTGITLGGTKADNYTLNGVTTATTTANITKSNQAGITITNQPATPVYGQTFTLGTSGGSGTGNIVTWSAIGCAAVTSTGAVTVSGVGNVTITAIKAGDNNYNPVTDTYSFTSGKATPVIGTVTASSIYVGDTLSMSNLSRTDSTIEGTLTWETNAVFDASTLGNKSATYTFTVTGTDAENYNNLTGQNVTVDVNTRKILSVAPQTPITDKIYGTIQSSIGLPATVNVTAQGINADVTTSVAVTWSLLDYNSSLLTAQTLTGTLVLTGNPEFNNSDSLTASAIVTLQPLVAKNINNVSAKLKVGATDGTAILKALVTNQFDASVDTTATDAANWPGFPLNYNTSTTGAVTVQVKYVEGCIPTSSAITINYEVVNPSSLAYTTSTTSIAAINANNVTAGALLIYVNGLNALNVTWPTGTTGSSILANTAPAYTTLSGIYVKTGTTYTFSQSYLGQTLTQSITVSEVQQDQPSLTINYETETINTTAAAIEYSSGLGVWHPCTENMSITSWLGNIVPFRTAAEGFKVASDQIVIFIPTKETAPPALSATINDSNTEISVAGLVPNKYYEYSTGGINYSDLSSNGKIAVSNYLSSIDIRKKFVAATSFHSLSATVAVRYALTFNSTSGSAISAIYAVSGAAISAPNAPTRSGYTFSGWNSSEAGTGSAITFPYVITGNVTVYAKWTVYVAPSNNTNTPLTPPPAQTEVIIMVNDKPNTMATSLVTKTDDKTITTVTLDDKKIEEKLKSESNNSTITIPVKNDSDVVVGQLNGQTVKSMENKEAVLEIKTENVTYTLPASQINIDQVSSQIGEKVELKNIIVNITIAEPSKDTVRIVEDTANKNSYQMVIKPVDFEITCTSGNKTVDVSKFNGYVERTVAIPDGVDPSKITTGIVLNKDGTFSHVPTSITRIDGKYYAKINSLTNSTYSVIWSPKTFKDVETHWAKEAINDMGSRLIIGGVGDNKFEPNRDITRAEFATIIVKALGLMKPSTGKTSFTDVSKNAGYYDAVSIAYEYGIISGYGNGKFGPKDKITREQAMAMISKAMKITGLKVTFSKGEVEKLLSSYVDTNKSTNASKLNIAACVKTGIMSERAGKTIAPKEYITRAEVAVMVRNLLQKSKLI